jgi:DNA replication and repair protein RecF
MHIAEVRLRNFRNHADTRLQFGEGVNVLVGRNGQGKTNILEAISYLSLTKSFYASSDATAVRFGTERFDVEGEMVAGSGLRYAVHASYGPRDGEKIFSVNNARPESLASVIGSFPVVILSPENNAITFGGPAARRRFIDITLSQVSRVYLEDLLEYRRVLRQRNRLLNDARSSGANVAGVIEPWTVSLVEYGSRIVKRRQDFVMEFKGYIDRSYATLVESGEKPAMEYQSFSPLPEGGTVEGVARMMERQLQERMGEEIRRGSTLVGPHRDELRFSINGAALQQYASQGQHKTFLVALKAAEFLYLRECRAEAPIVLLDDLFSELDEARSRSILQMIARLGQTIITTTGERILDEAAGWNDHLRRFIIENGTSRADTVSRQESA